MAIGAATQVINLTRTDGPAIGGGSGFTVTFWCKYNSPGGATKTITIFGMDNGGTEITLSLDPDAPDIRAVYNAEGSVCINTHVAANDTWFFVALTYDGTNVGVHTKFIGEGSLTSQTTSDGTDTLTPNNLFLPQGPYNYSGTVDVPSVITDVKIWASVLTTPQILTESGKYNPQVASPWAFYKLADSATAATDSSGNTRTLTVNGAISTQTDPTGVWDDVDAPTYGVLPQLSGPKSIVARPLRRRAPPFWPPASPLPFASSPAGATADLSGSVNVALTPSGDLKGTASMSGTMSVSVAPDGNLRGLASLSGAVAATVTPDANLRGLASLSGSQTIDFTPSGDVTPVSSGGDMSGSMSIALTPSGDLRGLASLSGAVAASLAPAGSMAGLAQMQGAVAVAVAPAGDLKGSASLSGPVSVSVAPAGAMGGLASLSGSALGTLSLSGQMTGAARMQGAVDASLALTGNLRGLASFSGSSLLTLVFTGDVTFPIEDLGYRPPFLAVIGAGQWFGVDAGVFETAAAAATPSLRAEVGSTEAGAAVGPIALAVTGDT